MNIYIYGSKSFKKDVHNELDHSNIKFKLDDNSSILELNNLDDLKNSIQNNSDDIFLIDDSKIIKKNKFNSKFKFLIPKDGIEDTYLFEHGIGDISFDSIEDLSKHIVNKIQSNETLDTSKISTYESDFDERDEIHDSISNIVNEAYDFENEDDENHVQLDDELSMLLSSNDMDDTDDDFDALKDLSSLETNDYNPCEF